jgi:hypothetical protein
MQGWLCLLRDKFTRAYFHGYPMRMAKAFMQVANIDHFEIC